MKTKLIPVTDAIPGMIVADNIYTFNNILLIDKGASITDRVITRLMFYNIEQIEIIDGDSISTLPNIDQDVLNTISEQERTIINDFNISSAECVSSFKSTLSNAFIDNEELDSSKLLTELDGLLSKTRNSFHLLSLLNVMKEKDDVIFHHSINVALIASIFGKILNLDDKELTTLKLGAILHDVGKLAIPQRLLTTHEKLSEKDFSIIKSHTTKGYDLLSKQELPLEIKNIALMHHERCDGSGYPNGLKSNEIDKFAKIIAIADCYEAMTSPRAYRDIINPFEVIEFFETDGYRLFDPEYVIPFINAIVDSYVNKKVLLSNGAKGTIILINKLALSKPMIKLDNGGFIDLYVEKNVSIVRVML